MFFAQIKNKITELFVNLQIEIKRSIWIHSFNKQETT